LGTKQRIREGEIQTCRAALVAQQLMVFAALDSPPRGYMTYLNEEETELSIVHLFPDAGAMDRHMIRVDELARKARGFMESVSLDIYGTPSDRILDIAADARGSARCDLFVSLDWKVTMSATWGILPRSRLLRGGLSHGRPFT
jgi:hypothetical protein